MVVGCSRGARACVDLVAAAGLVVVLLPRAPIMPGIPRLGNLFAADIAL